MHGLATIVLSVGVCGFAGKARAESSLEDAIKARTDIAVLTEEVRQLPADVRGPMRKVITKAEAEDLAGNLFLTKDKYGDAVASFQRAATLYRQALDGKKVLERLATAYRKAERAKMLAEASAEADKLADARRMLLNAEGYVEAAEFEAAIGELEKCRKAYEALLTPGAAATLEQAVAARTAMLSARRLIKSLPALETAEPKTRGQSPAAERPDEPAAAAMKRGSLPDLLTRARKAETGAADSLQERDYTPALALFQSAEKLYREAAVVQSKRESVLAARKSVEASMKVANAAFQSEARPASFERGKQLLADAEKAMAEEDLDAVKRLFSEAAEAFAKAHAEAELANQLGKAQEGWAAALAAADEELLGKHSAEAFSAAKEKAAKAEAEAAAGKSEAAASLYQEAVTALKTAGDEALTRQNFAKAAPLVARLEAAVAKRDKFAAEDLLAEVASLIPKDARIAALRQSVEAVPGLKKLVALDLGGGVKMEFVLIRPGSFTMGDDSSTESAVKPAHKVTLSKPFYLGKYEVTQKQWETVMGSNPSNFKGPQNPVENVSWDDCQAFLQKLNDKLKSSSGKFTLPTEAQWEYACRAGTTTKYSFGDDEARFGEYAWFAGNAGSKTHPVGEKKVNAFGLYDMHGNVWEWCADWYSDTYYAASTADDPLGPDSGATRVLRGGSWNYYPDSARSAFRYRGSPGLRSNIFGFRVSRTP
jgi:formylglycine-generating enzyme required for sulfatase activity